MITNTRPSAFIAAAGSPPAIPPPQTPLVQPVGRQPAVQMLLSGARTKTSVPPNALAMTAIWAPGAAGRPMFHHPLQPLLGAVCQRCHTVPVATQNSANRPSATATTDGSLERLAPNCDQSDQPPPGEVCQVWRSA